MKIGILGTGFGAFHAKLCKNIDGVEEIIIFGRNRDKLKDLRANSGVSTTTNIEEILNNDEIELIDVCLPSILHREYVIRALEKGKHVFCETPVALTAEDTEAMVKAEQKYQKKVFVDLFLRFEYPYQYLYEINKSNQYGKLLSFRIQRKTPPIWGDLGVDKITANLMMHDIDFTSWLLGKPSDINAYSIKGRDGQCAVTSLLQYDNTMAEIIGSSMMAVTYPFAVSYEAVFEKAVITYYKDYYKNHMDEKFKLFTAEGISDIDINENNCYEEAIKHVITCINEDTIGINRLSEAKESLEVALIIQNHILHMK